MSLRKEKAARLKIQVLDQTLKLIGRKSFDDLYVDDICEKVKISKVTLFKYFPQKEDILLYYFRLWCMSRCVDIHQKPREGMAAIHFVFDKLSEELEDRPGMMLSVVAYLSDSRRSPKPFPVKMEEKKLYFRDSPDIASIEMLSLDQMFEKFSLEAIFKKEMTKSFNTRDITNLLLALFFGGIVTCHINHLSTIKMFFRRNVDLLVRQ
ncbi:MAG: TetR/AcrR family transcriptional regulator [Chryseolinea sp.]